MIDSAQVTMTFADAMQAILDGHAITKLEWGNNFVYCQLNERLQLHKADGRWYEWIISAADMRGTDWIILDMFSPSASASDNA